MIFGDLNDFDRERYLYPAAMVKAFDFLQTADWGMLANGKYELDGEDMYVIIAEGETADISERRAERHFRYADIQYLISGEETMGIARYRDSFRIAEDLSDKDALLFDEVENETMLKLKAGQFAVFLPHDVHRPGCVSGKPQPIRKAIVKIDIRLLLQSNLEH